MKTLSALLILSTLPGLAALETRRSVRDGVYSEAQADRGSRTYRNACQTCHLPAQFQGATYMDSWTGQSARELFELIRTTMPQSNPGSLKRRQYADVLAYLFRLNAMPAGKEELKGDARTLKEIVIEGPYQSTPTNSQ